jgi:aryl carrier-like protein
MEARLLQLLAVVLERPVSALSVDAEFADQGLDSLLALRWSRAIADALGREVELEWFFDHPTIARLAAVLEPHDSHGAAPAR